MLINDLARVLAERRSKSGVEQFAILLGKECASAAGKPYEQVIRILSSMLTRIAPGLEKSMEGASLPELISAIPASGPLSSGNLSSGNLSSGNLSGGNLSSGNLSSSKMMYRMLQTYYLTLPVPLFYQDLSTMVKGGYFSRILTTNYDNLLEQALESPPSPMRKDRDYIVVNVPALEREELRHLLRSPHESKLLLLKLQGDLQRQDGKLDLAEVQAALYEHRKAVFSELSNDIVVAGYDHDSPGIDKALHAQEGGDIWWVSENGIDPALLSTLQFERDVHVVDGPDANPQRFFGALCTMLSRAPELSADGSSAPAELSDDETSDRVVLSEQLLRARDELDRVRRVAPPGASPEVDAQIAYQLQQIQVLEDQMRVKNRKQIVALMEQIRDAANDASLDTGTLNFVEKQTAAIRQELAAATPNQHIVSAAVTAIAVVARRLGQPTAEAAAAIMAYVPSGLARGA